MKKKSRFLLSFGILLTMCLAFVGTVFAAESGSSYYSFRIQANQANSTTDYYLYRNVGVTDYKKPWYINMTYSGEGTGTYTTYWLELSDGTNVSPDKEAKVGVEYKPAAYGTANSKNVYLSAENNNYNGNMYNVSGYWKAASVY